MASTIAREHTHEPVTHDATTRRILIATHGHEREGWTDELRGAVPRPGVVRLLVVDDVVPPPFTSLLPVARRLHGAALAASRQEAHERGRPVLDVLDALADLPRPVEVVRIPGCRDPGLTITTHAREWPADVVVVGRDSRGRLERALLGSVHERVVRSAPCAVLVVPAAPRAPVPKPNRRIALPPRVATRGGA
jgi:nucleotide-binding universal stress UspA family protein